MDDDKRNQLNRSIDDAQDSLRVDAFVQLVKSERRHQAARWGGGLASSLDRTDDARNGVADWVAYIARYAASWLPDALPPYGPDTLAAFRTAMVKVATLAYAAHEWAGRTLDRMDGGAGR